ncbi:MAG: MoxR family ATPase [Acidobacteriota bacterium]
MPVPQYTGDPNNRPANAPVWKIADPRRARLLDPRGYRPDEGLINAVNVALLLEQPLLVTGEPGTGKTQLAYSLAWELGLSPPLAYETKSTSTARDLFYNYDAIRHFRASQSHQENADKGEESALSFITWNALGEAVLRSQPRAKVEKWITSGFDHQGECRSVVLIDEIDKAPRDFPNDLLNEVEQLFFRVPELGNEQIFADPDNRPLLVLTSNSEKNLPDAFLRRCAYYHIKFPERQDLAKIVYKRVRGFAGSETPLLKDALDLFGLLRDEKKRHWEKQPATAELIGWLTVLRELKADFDQPLREQPEVLKKSISALVKGPKDQEYVTELVEKRKW